MDCPGLLEEIQEVTGPSVEACSPRELSIHDAHLAFKGVTRPRWWWLLFQSVLSSHGWTTDWSIEDIRELYTLVHSKLFASRSSLYADFADVLPSILACSLRRNVCKVPCRCGLRECHESVENRDALDMKCSL
jgi:hypothetical protein